MLMPSYIYTIKSWQFKEQFNPISIDINKQVCPGMNDCKKLHEEGEEVDIF